MVVYELYKKIYREQGKGLADEFLSQAANLPGVTVL
jgi:hypothetical protein